MNLGNGVVPEKQMAHSPQDAVLQIEAPAQTREEITKGSGQVYQKTKSIILQQLCTEEDASAKSLLYFKK